MFLVLTQTHTQTDATLFLNMCTFALASEQLLQMSYDGVRKQVKWRVEKALPGARVGGSKTLHIDGANWRLKRIDRQSAAALVK